MVRSKLQRDILSVLHDSARRGRWWTTRAIAEAVYRVDYASQEQADRVRASLKTLARAGEVKQSPGLFQHEWMSTRYPAQEESTFAKDVRAAWEAIHDAKPAPGH